MIGSTIFSTLDLHTWQVPVNSAGSENSVLVWLGLYNFAVGAPILFQVVADRQWVTVCYHLASINQQFKVSKPQRALMHSTNIYKWFMIRWLLLNTGLHYKPS